MKRSYLIITTLLIAMAMGLGWFLGQKNIHQAMPDAGQTHSVNGVEQDASGKSVLYWYDPMVPEQKFDKPGKSPFMDMQLAPKYANTDSTGKESGVVISSQTVQNLGIRIEKVESKRFGESLSGIGRIAPDERRIYTVQTRIPGFVEKLLVRAVGDPVKKGQKIAEIYAPELLAAQQEYLALLTLHQIDGDDALKQAARSRLQLLGMSNSEISTITQSGKSNSRFGVYAPASGILTELGVREGGQLMAGSSLVQISDLSQVWLIAEVPENDAARLKPGVTAEVRLQSLPNEVLNGKVSYLYPTLDESSRTLPVRIELPNKSNQLRPGMYANVEFLGQTHSALSVSTQSIISTGKRKIVILKESNGYRPVEIKTGQEYDGYTEVLSGLSQNEEVVTSGQFLIDSEASLSGVLARLSSKNQVLNEDMPLIKTVSDKPNQENHAEKIPKGTGEVVKIDAQANHITLKHDPIPELGWPSMTMGFMVKDSKQLSSLKVGDKVQFDLKADSSQNPDLPQQYMIEHIEKSLPLAINKESKP
jgi:membrane fusion protein, copper/silver efflux system